jgi:hypothetical protein
MTNDELVSWMEKQFSLIVDLKRSKGKIYGSDTNAFCSIDAVSLDLDMTREDVIFTFMAKHWNVLKDNRDHLDEMIDFGERIDDLVIYLMMLKALTTKTG